LISLLTEGSLLWSCDSSILESKIAVKCVGFIQIWKVMQILGHQISYPLMENSRLDCVVQGWGTLKMLLSSYCFPWGIFFVCVCMCVILAPLKWKCSKSSAC